MAKRMKNTNRTPKRNPNRVTLPSLKDLNVPQGHETGKGRATKVMTDRRDRRPADRLRRFLNDY